MMSIAIEEQDLEMVKIINDAEWANVYTIGLSRENKFIPLKGYMDRNYE